MIKYLVDEVIKMIHIVMEDEFSSSTWCYYIMEGLMKAAKHKRMTCMIEKENFDSKDTDLITIIGTSPNWIYKTVTRAQRIHSAHIILISNRAYQLSANNICTDLFLSMKNVIAYLLNDCGKHHIAFYGASPSSSSDLQKLRGFGENEHVYYNHGNLKQCYENFYHKILDYDAVICANDYAAISLMQNLKIQDPDQIDRLFIVSFANAHISQLYTPSITSVALNYYEYGKVAVKLYELLQKNDEISSANINIKSNILVRATTKYIPYTEKNTITETVCLNARNDFFDDSEIQDLISIEKIFENIDDIDITILNDILNGKSYESIAQALFMSTNGIKYRISKLLNSSGIKNRKDFLRIVCKYFNKDMFNHQLHER